MKYLTDNFRLNYTEDISLKDIKNFVPDVISLLGAPEKLISFPQIGYFDIKGPAGNIKTIVTPLKSEADYFGDVKKPRLTVINEKVKEIAAFLATVRCSWSKRTTAACSWSRSTATAESARAR